MISNASVVDVTLDFSYDSNGNHSSSFSFSSSSLEEDFQERHECHYQTADYLYIRFPLVIFVSTFVCGIGAFGNLLSIYVLTRKRMQASSNWFLVILAACDFGVLTTFVLIYAVEVLYDYFGSFELYQFWLAYAKEVYLLSHLCQGGAVYSTVAATIERWIFLGYSKRISQYFCTKRVLLLSTILFVSFVVASVVPKYFEVDLVTFKGCQGFERYALVPSPLLSNELYTIIYSAWYSNLVFVLLPFAILFLLNVIMFQKIIRRLPRQDRTPRFLKPWIVKINGKMYRRRTKQATVVLLIVAFIFLTCNLPSVLLTILEQFFSDFLQRNRAAYGFFRDVVNLLAVVNASVNFLVYMIFGKEFRRHTRLLPRKIWRALCGKPSKKHSTQSRTGGGGAGVVQPLVPKCCNGNALHPCNSSKAQLQHPSSDNLFICSGLAHKESAD